MRAERNGSRGTGLAVRRRGRWTPRLARRVSALLVVLALAVVAHGAAYALYPYPYPSQVRVRAAQAGLDPLLVLAVMRTESRFRTGARSADGAVGLMQLTPATATWVAAQEHLPPPTETLLPDPSYNITLGVWYLGHLQHYFGGRLVPAVAAYNAGPAPVSVWLSQSVWRGTLDTADRIPFPETRRFVQRAFGAYGVYRLLYR